MIYPDLRADLIHFIFEMNVGKRRMQHYENSPTEILNKLSPFDWVRRLDELFDTKFHPPESFQSLELTKLVKVNENFGTMRKMIEILNHDYSKNCKNGLPIQ